MKAQGKRVPTALAPVASVQREWDDAVVEFFVLKQWRRSHDRVVDGSVTYLPVAAVLRQVLWQGRAVPAQDDATSEAMAKAAEMGQPQLFGGAP